MQRLITDITGAVIINSRGSNTIAVSVHAGEHIGTFALPDGASTGSREVHVKEAHEAVEIINVRLKPHLLGRDVTNQQEIDTLLHKIDATALFENIGGNTALGVSIASCKTAAQVQGIQVWKYIENIFATKKQATTPLLFINLINGGKHAIHGSVIQEHQIIVDTDDCKEAYVVARSVQEKLELILIDMYGSASVSKGDEGGFVVPSSSVFQPFDFLVQAINEVGSTIPIHIGADIAASSFYHGSQYMIENQKFSASELLKFYSELHAHVPQLCFMEDPFFESDFDSYGTYKQKNKEVLVIGDDLTTTNATLLKKAITSHAIGALIIKPNQIGTLSDTLATMRLAYAHDIKCIVSHRSGETLDDFIADLAIGTGAYGLKAGAPGAKERDAKYNRLITILQTPHD